MFNGERGEMIGYGGEKNVYEDAENQDRVIGEFHDGAEGDVEAKGDTPNQVKARYYLTKILHLLHPQNIPDMHWATSEPNSYQADRKELSANHKAISLISADQSHVHPDERVPFEEAFHGTMDDERVKKLRSDLTELEIGSLDTTPVNFSHDSEGNAVYLDTFDAWKVHEKGDVELLFSFKKLEDALAGLPEQDRPRAAAYIERLKALYQTEIGSK